MTTPEQIGRYAIERELGRGGMAVVYLGRDPYMERPVAVKVLPRQFTFDQQFRNRFQREARTIAALEHPAIVPVYDFGEHDDQPYLVMRYMTGGGLRRRMTGQPLPLDEIARILDRLASALDRAHARGVIHRDIKPDNVLFDEDGLPYLADFGIARLAEATQTMTIAGTPAYMSPEQAHGDVALDGRSDIYALGVMLYEMLTGRQPYVADTPTKQMLKHVLEPVPDVCAANPALPPACRALVERAMAKQPAARYQTAADLAAAVGELVAPQPARVGRIDLAAPTVVDLLPPRPVVAPPMPDAPPDKKRTAPPRAQPPAPAARSLPAAPGRARLPAPAWAWWAGALALVIVAALGLRAVMGGGQGDNPAAGAGGAAATQTALAIALAAPTAAPTDAPTPAPTDAPTPAPTATATATTTPTPTPRPTNTPRPTRTPTVTPTATPDPNLPPPNPALGSTWVRPVDGMTLVYVPGGTFPMGSADGLDHERPVHNVTLDGFWLDQTEVTNAQYARCVAAGECRASTYANDSRFNGANHPVVGVDWHNAAAYCAWAGGRLPTEAEWEYAARGPEAPRYPWGNTQPACNIANYWGRDGGCVGGTTEVGSYPNGASWVGALDMAGNVREWVNDWYDSRYYANSPAENPRGPADGQFKALRGGAWNYDYQYVRAAVRDLNAPTFTYYGVGFRCAQE